VPAEVRAKRAAFPIRSANQSAAQSVGKAPDDNRRHYDRVLGPEVEDWIRMQRWRVVRKCVLPSSSVRVPEA